MALASSRTCLERRRLRHCHGRRSRRQPVAGAFRIHARRACCRSRLGLTLRRILVSPRAWHSLAQRPRRRQAARVAAGRIAVVRVHLPRVFRLLLRRCLAGLRVVEPMAPRSVARCELRSNPSLEPKSCGSRPWPRYAVVHDAPRGQGCLPPRAAQFKR